MLVTVDYITLRERARESSVAVQNFAKSVSTSLRASYRVVVFSFFSFLLPQWFMLSCSRAWGCQ